MTEEIRTIRCGGTPDATIRLPSSKSYTNRALVAAALAEGESAILSPSESDDTSLLVAGLGEFGIDIQRRPGGLLVQGGAGRLALPQKELFAGNAGTTMRFLAGVAALAPGDVTLTGSGQMNVRPIGDLLSALKMAGVRSACSGGYPPVTIHGGSFGGGRVDIDASQSSQFLSALLLVGPYAKRPLVVHVVGRVASEPYIPMTLHVMRAFGAAVDTLDYRNFTIDNTLRYLGREFRVEADASAATYFLGAGAITGGLVRIPDLSAESLQGDVRFASILRDLGCTIIESEEGMQLRGGKLHGIEIDMNAMPDSVPTLAVLAAFAEGPTAILNIGQLRYKETDRITAVATELRKLGAKIEIGDDQMVVHPRPLHGGLIETYGDHRMAMSFAMAGLRVENLRIKDPRCVTKSFPGFWDEFRKLEAQE